jgi:hypothetical protein
MHKLIVAAVRHSESPKAGKDIAQAEQILRAMLPRRSFAIEEAWEEAWQRGPQWREYLRRGMQMLDTELRSALQLLFKERKSRTTRKDAKNAARTPSRKPRSTRGKAPGKTNRGR